MVRHDQGDGQGPEGLDVGPVVRRVRGVVGAYAGCLAAVADRRRGGRDVAHVGGIPVRPSRRTADMIDASTARPITIATEVRERSRDAVTTAIGATRVMP